MTYPPCERCGADVIPLQAFHPASPPKRFCSARCQKAAEKQRWQSRRRAALKETTND